MGFTVLEWLYVLRPAKLSVRYKLEKDVRAVWSNGERRRLKTRELYVWSQSDLKS